MENDEAYCFVGIPEKVNIIYAIFALVLGHVGDHPRLAFRWP